MVEEIEVSCADAIEEDIEEKVWEAREADDELFHVSECFV